MTMANMHGSFLRIACVDTLTKFAMIMSMPLNDDDDDDELMMMMTYVY